MAAASHVARRGRPNGIRHGQLQLLTGEYDGPQAQSQPQRGVGHYCSLLLFRVVQAEVARVRAEAAAEVAAATARAAAAASTAALDAASDGAPSEVAAGQKAQLERTVAELTAALSARQKDFEARIRCTHDCQHARQDSSLRWPNVAEKKAPWALPQGLKALTFRSCQHKLQHA